MARKKSNIHYIYKIVCLVTNRYYIGMHSTCNIDDDYMGSGKRLRYSIRKHGVENHKKEILEFFETRELLIEAEKKAITPEMIIDKNCMNLMGGGKGGYVSEEHYQITSKIGGDIHANKMKNDKQYRDKVIAVASETLKKCWKDGKLKNIKKFTGMRHSEETIEKYIKDRKGKGLGRLNSQYGTCWITKTNINKKIKNEELEKYLNEGWVKGRK